MATIRTIDASLAIEGLLAEAIERELEAEPAKTDGADVDRVAEPHDAPAIEGDDTVGGVAAARSAASSKAR